MSLNNSLKTYTAADWDPPYTRFLSDIESSEVTDVVVVENSTKVTFNPTQTSFKDVALGTFMKFKGFIDPINCIKQASIEITRPSGHILWVFGNNFYDGVITRFAENEQDVEWEAAQAKRAVPAH